MTDRFLICLPFVLAQECPHPTDWGNPANFSNDAHDPGGKTMCGIIQREYDIWRKEEGLPVRDVRQLTLVEGYAIYTAWYWQPHCSSLPVGLDLSFFDTCVNMGTHEAIILLQRSLLLQADGLWGPATTAAVNLLHSPLPPTITSKPLVGGRALEIITAFASYRLFAYKQMRGWQYFHHDWANRTAEIKAESLKMVQP